MMKKVLKRFVLPVVLVSICLMATMFPRPAFGSGTQNDAIGKEQLVRALNAAFVRVMASGKWLEIYEPEFAHGFVNISDCYPDVANTPFPANPTGLLLQVINTRQLKIGSHPPSPDSSTTSPLIIQAMLDEINTAYNLSPPIQRVDVYLAYQSSTLLFQNLNAGLFDVTDIVAATGGIVAGWPGTPKQPRRYVARPTCTVSGVEQFLYVKPDSPYQTMTDVLKIPNAKMCWSPTSNQIGTAYFSNATGTLTTMVDAPTVCGGGVMDGTYDAWLDTNPDDAQYGPRLIETHLYTGVPMWVAADPDQDQDMVPDYQDNCPSIANVNQADADGDGIGDVCDNCPVTPNGPKGGSCTQGDIEKAGTPCSSDSDCGPDGFCSMNQEDTNRDGSGDACGPIAHIDIQPSTLNTDSKDQDAVVTIKVSPPAGYTADAIIPESVMIADIGGNTTNIAPLKWKIENGKSLQLKYNRSEILNVLRSYQLTGSVEMTITGRLTDNKLFIGSDRVTVKTKK